MAKKKKTLPRNFRELIEAGDIDALKAVYEECELDARGGYNKETALSFYKVPDELVGWLVGQGADINAADNYKRTPLHNQAANHRGNVKLLLDLGADINALNYRNETPLHAAADSYNPKAVQTLLEHGADVHARNNGGFTALSKALMCCNNADIANMAEVAGLLLAAGAKITEDMREAVKRIGKDFEFYKESFNKDMLGETETALAKLYKLFNVEPAAPRKVYDCNSAITVKSSGWAAQHEELWQLLVPGSGYAQTVQGEVIRITGRISYEIIDNGAVNWDSDFKKMLAALPFYFSEGVPLPDNVLQEVSSLIKCLENGNGNEEPARLCELAVLWVLSNPDPVLLEQPVYKR